MRIALTPETKVYVCDDKGPCSRRTVKSTRTFKHRTSSRCAQPPIELTSSRPNNSLASSQSSVTSAKLRR
jgi:hypothetical protein